MVVGVSVAGQWVCVSNVWKSCAITFFSIKSFKKKQISLQAKTCVCRCLLTFMDIIIKISTLMLMQCK